MKDSGRVSWPTLIIIGLVAAIVVLVLFPDVIPGKKGEAGISFYLITADGERIPLETGTEYALTIDRTLGQINFGTITNVTGVSIDFWVFPGTGERIPIDIDLESKWIVFIPEIYDSGWQTLNRTVPTDTKTVVKTFSYNLLERMQVLALPSGQYGLTSHFQGTGRGQAGTRLDGQSATFITEGNLGFTWTYDTLFINAGIDIGTFRLV